VIVVTGTKRSGTSMWMRILDAAGFPPIGKAFPETWGTTIRDANQDGFYESLLRNGIYHETNPHPQTGRYVPPGEATARMAVKVFAPGFVRSWRAFLDHVIVSMRPWREYCASLRRLYAMEHAATEEKLGAKLEPRKLIPPELEWWGDNYGLLRDLLMRQPPAKLLTYDRVLRDPAREVGAVVRWLGGDVAAAVAIVDPARRTQRDVPEPDGPLSARARGAFDALYQRVDGGGSIDAPLLEELAVVHREVAPLFRAAFEEAKADQPRWRRALAEAKEAKLG